MPHVLELCVVLILSNCCIRDTVMSNFDLELATQYAFSDDNEPHDDHLLVYNPILSLKEVKCEAIN